MPISGPTTVRRHLGRRLRRLREAAAITEQAVADAKIASRQKLWRLESGKAPVRVADVVALCMFYGADGDTRKTLEELAKGTTGQGWSEEYGDALPDWANLYVALEASASEIRLYDPELIHGLLQTPDYIRAVFRGGDPDIDPEIVERQVKLRGQRHEMLLYREPPIRLTAVFSAGVLTRPVGGTRVMNEQVRRLRELSRLDHIRIRVLPWKIGAHGAMDVGAFTFLDFADSNDPPVVYVEYRTGSRYLEKREELTTFRKALDLIEQQSVPIEEYSRGQ